MSSQAMPELRPTAQASLGGTLGAREKPALLFDLVRCERQAVMVGMIYSKILFLDSGGSHYWEERNAQLSKPGSLEGTMSKSQVQYAEPYTPGPEDIIYICLQRRAHGFLPFVLTVMVAGQVWIFQ